MSEVTHAIVQKWLKGENDAGGTIRQLEIELLEAQAALAAEKEAHGKTFERLVNVGNVAEQLKGALDALVRQLPEGEIELAREVWGNTNARVVLDAVRVAKSCLAAYDEFRTATKPEEAE